MSEHDEFARLLLEEAKRFLEKGGAESDLGGQTAYLHASLLLGFGSLEAHINGIADDFLIRPDLPLIERSLLSEKEIRLVNGEFIVSDQLKIYRLEDRIQFLYRKFSGQPVDKNTRWWAALKTGIDLRNKLTHPKDAHSITSSQVRKALEAILETLDVLYKAIYRLPYPAINRGLDSTLVF